MPGEIAEAMLDGTMCEGCGEFFDDVFDGARPPGHPRRCGCQGPEEAAPAPVPPVKKGRRYRRNERSRRAMDLLRRMSEFDWGDDPVESRHALSGFVEEAGDIVKEGNRE